MAENIIINNKAGLEKIIRNISRAGAKKMHVISDFDRTLTHVYVGGQRRPSLISILRDENYLSPNYSRKARALFNKYHPLEANPDIPLKEKKMAMQAWWKEHFSLLIDSGLNKKDIEKIIFSGKVRLRKGVLKFIDSLHNNNIPLIIMSSTGLGGDAISQFLRKEGKLYNNIFIISNFIKWNKKRNAVGFREPIIHSLNKDEALIDDFPQVHAKVKNKRNVLLIGDNLEDIGMIKGFDYDNLVKIGFLNEDVEKNLKRYKKAFDIIIANDSSFDYLNLLLKDIIKHEL